MKQALTQLLTALLLCGMFAASSNAAIVPCASATGNVLNITGGCTIAGLTFSNFQVVNADGGSGTAEIDLVSASIVNAGGLTEVALNFNPNLGTGTEGGTITDLHFSYTVSGSFPGADLMNAGISSAVHEIICNAATPGMFGCPSPTNVLWNVVALDAQFGLCVGNTASGTATTSVCNFGAGGANEAAGPVQAWVFKDISITSAATSHLTSFTETFVVPEPMSMTLMGIGLSVLGLLGRRRARK